MTKDDRFYLPLVIALGDGYMQYGKVNGEISKLSKKANLSVAHKYTHEDYLLYKKQLLENLGFIVFFGDKKKQYGHQQKYISVGKIPILGSVKKQLYIENNIKLFKKSWCSKLDDLALAILWMDDGCLARSKFKKIQKNGNINEWVYHYGDIATHSFSKESVENICYWLKNRFDISAKVYQKKRSKKNNLTPNYFIRLNRDNLKLLISIVKPHIEKIPSMIYKITFLDINNNPIIL